MRKWSRFSSEARMPHDAPSLLAASGLTAGYRRLQVLWGVDLEVHARESVVLLGANGAGKTTLLKALIGLLDLWAVPAEQPRARTPRRALRYIPGARRAAPRACQLSLRRPAQDAGDRQSAGQRP